MRFRPLLGGVLLAGCLAPAAAPVVGGPEATLPAPRIEVDVSLSGCREVGVGRFVSFERARELLPAGFEPADAAAFFGMPAPAGRAAVLSGHLVCEGSVLDGGPVAWADLIVPVERPGVPGLDLDEGRIDVYELAHYTSGRATFDLFASVGFAVHLSDVAADTGALLAPIASAGTRADGAELLSFEVAGAVEQTSRFHARFWHVTPDGLAYVEHTRTPTLLRLGVLVSCAAEEGSLFAEAFGAGDCTGRDSFGGVFPAPSDFASTFHHVPDTTVAKR